MIRNQIITNKPSTQKGQIFQDIVVESDEEGRPFSDDLSVSHGDDVLKVAASNLKQHTSPYLQEEHVEQQKRHVASAVID